MIGCLVMSLVLLWLGSAVFIGRRIHMRPIIQEKLRAGYTVRWDTSKPRGQQPEVLDSERRPIPGVKVTNLNLMKSALGIEAFIKLAGWGVGRPSEHYAQFEVELVIDGVVRKYNTIERLY